MEIAFTQVDSGVNGETFAHFDQGFDSFVVPAHGTANSGRVPNVLLTQGAIASLGIIPLGKLDVFSAVTAKCVSLNTSPGHRTNDIFSQDRGLHDTVASHHDAQRAHGLPSRPPHPLCDEVGRPIRQRSQKRHLELGRSVINLCGHCCGQYGGDVGDCTRLYGHRGERLSFQYRTDVQCLRVAVDGLC